MLQTITIAVLLLLFARMKAAEPQSLSFYLTFIILRRQRNWKLLRFSLHALYILFSFHIHIREYRGHRSAKIRTFFPYFSKSGSRTFPAVLMVFFTSASENHAEMLHDLFHFHHHSSSRSEAYQLEANISPCDAVFGGGGNLLFID